MTKADAAAIDLDPADWDAFRHDAHQALDAMITHMQGVRERPVWRPLPNAARARLAVPLPQGERALREVLDDVDAIVTPYVTGNTHPAFMGWVHGAGTPVGMVAEMIAAGLNANCGGRNHVGLDVEAQVVAWMREAFGFPESASGLFVTGTSMANFVGLIVARNAALGDASRRAGIAQSPQLCAYASKAAHGCVMQAMQLGGHGSDHLRLIACDAEGRLDVAALRARIAQDRAAGLRPFMIVGTAGSVDTGAIDPLNALADLAREEGLWLHVDGAFGALCVLSPRLKPLVAGLERADSIALDFHKWAHAPYDAGFILVRDGSAQRRAFASPANYLARAPQGLAAGETWPCDLGPDLSRGFRALKVWMAFQTFGAERIGACIAQTCDVARHLEARIAASPRFALRAPVTLNIVCFSVKRAEADRVNRAIVERLHMSGRAAPSITLLEGQAVIRCAIVNHRTTRADIDRFMLDVEDAAQAVQDG